MTVGDKVKFLRERRGLSQEDLAKLVGYKSKTSINKIEIGKQDIKRSRINKFAEALGTTTTYLIGVTDDPDPNYVETDKTSKEAIELAREILKLSPDKIKALKDFIKFQQKQ